MLIYIIAALKLDRVSFISMTAMAGLIILEHVTQDYIFAPLDMHPSFDYLAKLIILIPWAYFLHHERHSAVLMIYSACCFEVLVAVNILLNPGVETSLYIAYPYVVFSFHVLAGSTILGGGHGGLFDNSPNRSGGSNTRKVRG